MPLFSFIACALNRHEPLRRDVTWDGRCYVGRCRHCGTPIERLGRRKWRKRDTVAEDRRERPSKT